MGINNKKHLVYVVDLGLSKKYMKDSKIFIIITFN
jgi:hypothetical protein